MSFARKPSAVGNERHHPHTLSTLVSTFAKHVKKNHADWHDFVDKDFQGASSAAAAKAMKSELANLASQIQNEEERKVR